MAALALASNELRSSLSSQSTATICGWHLLVTTYAIVATRRKVGEITGYDSTNCTLDWMKLSVGYLLQHSADPTKPIYNTEWHGVGSLAWRDEYMAASYATAVVWLGLYHGDAMNIAWYWPRGDSTHTLTPPKSHFPNSFVGSFATLPSAINAFLRAFMTATAHGKAIATLGWSPPRTWLIRS